MNGYEVVSLSCGCGKRLPFDGADYDMTCDCGQRWSARDGIHGRTEDIVKPKPADAPLWKGSAEKAVTKFGERMVGASLMVVSVPAGYNFTADVLRVIDGGLEIRTPEGRVVEVAFSQIHIRRFADGHGVDGPGKVDVRRPAEERPMTYADLPVRRMFEPPAMSDDAFQKQLRDALASPYFDAYNKRMTQGGRPAQKITFGPLAGYPMPKAAPPPPCCKSAEKTKDQHHSLGCANREEWPSSIADCDEHGRGDFPSALQSDALLAIRDGHEDTPLPPSVATDRSVSRLPGPNLDDLADLLADDVDQRRSW